MDYQPGIGEYFATAVLLLIVLGPIVWVLLRGRRAGAPTEDRHGYSSINEEIRRKNTDWRS